MPSTSRRRVLWSAIGFLGALAGCSADSNPSPTPTPGGPPGDALTDPPTVTLRNPTIGRVVTRGDDGTPSDADSEDRIWRHTLIADAKTSGSLTVADVDGADRARQFLDNTDFAAETIYVEQRELGECYEQELCWVQWTDSSIETSYASGYRDADVACDVNANGVVADLIRLPVALDLEQIHQYGSSTGSDRCRTADGEGASSSGVSACCSLNSASAASMSSPMRCQQSAGLSHAN